MIALKRHTTQKPDLSAKKHGHRLGAMFAYFMVYLMLAGATTATAGMLLHQMFRARTADEDRGNGIRQLLRIDSQLRTDWSTATQHTVAANSLTLQTADETSIVYSVDGDRVQRIVRSSNAEVEGSDRFQFPKRSMLQFFLIRSANDNSDRATSVTFRLVSPVPSQASKSQAAASDGRPAKGRVVEIFLAAGLTADQPEPVQTEPTASQTTAGSETDKASQDDATGDDQ